MALKQKVMFLNPMLNYNSIYIIHQATAPEYIAVCQGGGVSNENHYGRYTDNTGRET